MSGPSPEERLLEGGLAFFGRITASISHEFNNCVTIIAEVAGLLTDLSELADQGRPVDPGRLRRQCELISRQVTRATQIIKGLNRFAHGVDVEATSFYPHEEVLFMTSLSERLASGKGFRFQVADTDTTSRVSGKRFVFHELLFVLFSGLFESGAAEGGVIDVDVRPRGGAVEVVVSAALGAGSAPGETRRSYASLLSAELGGDLDTTAMDDGRFVFTARLPAST